MGLINVLGNTISSSGGPVDPYPWEGDTNSFLGDGVNKRFVTDAPFFNINNSFSASIWVKSVTTGSLNTLFARDAAGGVQRAWNIIFRNTDNKLHVFFWNNDGTVNELISTTANVINDGAWHHLGITFDGNNSLKYYEDGTLDQTLATASTGIQQYVGSVSWVTLLTNGASSPSWASNWYVNEPALWDGTELSGTDITEIYNSGAPNDLRENTTPPTYYWREEYAEWNGSTWTMPDIMENGSDFTSQNMVLADRTTDTP
jgi:hypothetical protein